MKSITTLVKDIQELLLSEKAHVEEVVQTFSASLSQQLVQRLANERSAPTLRLSNLGTPDRKLWYGINRPELGEKLSASTRLKFLYGDVLEELILYLAEQSGHTVADRQKEVTVNGVRGHIDGTVDGELVDVKSASSYSFRKFASGDLSSNDPFGYITQLSSYGFALGVPRGHFLVADKTLGHLTLDTHNFKTYNYSKLVDAKREMLAWPQPPERCYTDEVDGKSGNRKLGVACSYCAFKRACWPGLRAFDYAGRPVFLTRVLREPRVREMGWAEVE
jgi:hypothetical protein